jgi:hypothetical protein
VIRDYFTGGFDLGDLTKGTKTNGDGPILPGDDAQDFSDEDSLAEDEGDADNQFEEDIEALMREGEVKPDDDEDRMSVDLFGPDMSSQPSGQQFGADNLIALLGPDPHEEHSFHWSDEQHDGMFDELSPKDVREQQSDEEMDDVQDMDTQESPKETKISSAELVKEWFPQFSTNQVLRFTELFGAQKAELSRPPLPKLPRGMQFIFSSNFSLCPCTT